MELFINDVILVEGWGRSEGIARVQQTIHLSLRKPYNYMKNNGEWVLKFKKNLTSFMISAIT